MIADIILAVLALTVGAAYACRVDRLSWWQHPALMSAHAAGGIAAMWVLTESAAGSACVWDAAILAGAVALLVATYKHIPKPACK